MTDRAERARRTGPFGVIIGAVISQSKGSDG